jgi:hypothetical protein
MSALFEMFENHTQENYIVYLVIFKQKLKCD